MHTIAKFKSIVNNYLKMCNLLNGKATINNVRN